MDADQPHPRRPSAAFARASASASLLCPSPTTPPTPPAPRTSTPPATASALGTLPASSLQCGLDVPLDLYGWAFSAFLLGSLVGASAAGDLSTDTERAGPGFCGFWPLAAASS